MKIILQRCLSAKVTVEGTVLGAIARGTVAFVGIKPGDGRKEIEYCADKLIGLRIFEDAQGKTNLSLDEVAGELLVVPNFTIYGETAKGRRPSFSGAERPALAEQTFDAFYAYLFTNFQGKIAAGRFGADMKVAVVNDGPFTMIIDSDRNG